MKFVLWFLFVKTVWFFWGIQAIKYHRELTGVPIESNLLKELFIALVIPDPMWILAFVVIGSGLLMTKIMTPETPE